MTRYSRFDPPRSAARAAERVAPQDEFFDSVCLSVCHAALTRKVSAERPPMCGPRSSPAPACPGQVEAEPAVRRCVSNRGCSWRFRGR